MDNIGSNNLAFKGRIGLTSDGYKEMMKTMPKSFTSQVKELKRFIKKELPNDTVVMMNFHNNEVVNQNRNIMHRDFTKTVKGARSPEDVILDMHIVGDKSRFGIDGDKLKYWVDRFKTHCKNIGLIN